MAKIWTSVKKWILVFCLSAILSRTTGLFDLEKWMKFREQSHHLQTREANGSHDWSYLENNGTSAWPEKYLACGGEIQSPINIATDQVKEDDQLESITFTGYDVPLTDLFVLNNGHTVQMRSRSPALPSIDHGGFDIHYAFSQLHFHWSDVDTQGSEHTIDERAFPMEMHIVHENMKQITEDEAGMAVLAVLFELSDNNNENFDSLVKSLEGVEYKGTTADVHGSILLYALLPVEVGHFYRYLGSLTTPPCTEKVLWSVFADTVPIGFEQMSVFRSLKSTPETEKNNPHNLVNNFRKPQPLNNRTVLEALPEC